tara:strand:+ start:104 stop:739 length:636 start_codon:yes stop_codon:yes gene_type:complete
MRIRITPEFLKNNPKGTIKSDLNVIKDRDQQEDELNRIIGRIVTRCTELERQLDFLITDLLFGGIKNRESKIPHKTKGEVKFFQDFILNTDFMDFSSKWKIFRNLYKLHPFLNNQGELPRELAKDMLQVTTWRNRFAHGELSLKLFSADDISKEPYLFYYAENKPQEQIINNELFDDVLNPLFDGISKKMSEMRDKINEQFNKGDPNFTID